MNNFGDNATAVALIPVDTISTTTTGSAVDLVTYDGEAAVILNCGAGGAGATCDVKLTHSDTSGGTYTDVTGATFTQVGNEASHQKISINTNEMKQFVKAVCTVAGTASFEIAVSLVAVKKYLP
jgi:ferredoxin